MSFIQIIDYETDRSAEAWARLRDGIPTNTDSGAPYVRIEHTRDHDRPNHYMTIVEFPSYEAAMANSSRPEIDALARELAELCTSGPTYTNLDVRLTSP